MKNKQSYLTKALLPFTFVILGYMVKVYPDQLTNLIPQFRPTVAGNFCALLTFKLVTSAVIR